MMTDKITKPTDPSFALQGTKLRATQTKFQQRVSQGSTDPLTLPHRLVLALDCSGSMGGRKIEHLKRASAQFIDKCNPNDTALGVDTFPKGFTAPITTINLSLKLMMDTVSAGGDTPLYDCLGRIITNLTPTRVVLVSDGAPTDSGSDELVIGQYIESKIPIDCVHIGDSSSGEEVLKSIAERTGGLYIKFTDTNALTSGLSYLTPGSRALLTSGQVSASQLGAREVK